MNQPIQFADIEVQPELALGATTRHVDPALVQLSPWANRHEASFANDAFIEFKKEIAQSRGNVQPIKVRPLARSADAADSAQSRFELVYGHRRHHACLELGLPVQVLIEPTTDVELFEQMERENRGRQNLSAWEKGLMYSKAQDTKLYPSIRKMAEQLGLSLSIATKSVQLTKFHPSVIAAFSNPTAIQFRWITSLAQSAKADAKGLRERAQAIVKEKKGLSASAVFALLMNEPQAESPDASTAPESVNKVTVNHRDSPPAMTVMKSGQAAATLSTDSQGRAVLQFEAGALGAHQQAALVQLMEEFLSHG
jgi:ParB family transcriptional regulator, chromosome partitioning protein